MEVLAFFTKSLHGTQPFINSILEILFMEPTRVLHVAAIAFVLLLSNVLVFLLINPNTPQAIVFTNLTTSIYALFAVFALAYMAQFMFQLNRKWAGYWALITGGYFLWFIGEMIWGHYSAAPGPPGFSLADVAWLSGYVFVIAGFARANMDLRVIFRLRDTLFAGIFACFALAVTIFVLLPLLSVPADPLEKAASLAYPIADIVLVFLLLRLASAFVRSPLGFAWSVFCLGAMLDALADSWFAYLMLTNTYRAGHIYDLIYNLGYILTAIGALLFVGMSRAGLRAGEPGSETGKDRGATEVDALCAQLKGAFTKRPLQQAVSITTEKNSVDVGVAVLKLLTGENARCVFVHLDRPHAYFQELFREHGIPGERVHLLTLGPEDEGKPNISFVNSPDNLTLLKIKLDAAAGKRGKESGRTFVLMDCIPTLALYNDMNRLGRFLHDLNLSLRERGAYQIILLSPGGGINPSVLRFCDTNLAIS